MSYFYEAKISFKLEALQEDLKAQTSLLEKLRGLAEDEHFTIPETRELEKLLGL